MSLISLHCFDVDLVNRRQPLFIPYKSPAPSAPPSSFPIPLPVSHCLLFSSLWLVFPEAWKFCQSVFKNLLLAQLIVLTMPLLKNLCVFILSYLFLSRLILCSFNELLKWNVLLISFSIWSLIKQSLSIFYCCLFRSIHICISFWYSVILLRVSQVRLFQIFSSVTHYLVQQL